MPFGSLLGAIVFGILGVVLGTRMAGSLFLPVKVMGACLVVLGVAVAVGLLMKRTWARWLGAASGLWLAASAGSDFVEQGGVFLLTVVLASAAVTVFLVVPATGRPVLDPAFAAPAPSSFSRALCAVAGLAMVGAVGAGAWAVVLRPGSQQGPAPESRLVEAHEAAPSAAAPSGSPAPASPAKPNGGVAWRDFADGLKQAKSDRKLIVADFYATWCGPCKFMEKKTFHDPRVLTRLRDVVPVRVDAEETTARGGLRGADLALRYAIEVYPTIVVVDGNGREVARNSGVMEPDEFLAWIDSVIEKAGTTIARS
jgi:thiol:disulfide interchange protein